VTMASASTARLSALVRKYAAHAPPDFPDIADPVAVLIQSFLLWESSTSLALAAYDRLKTRVVDFNDFRVCLSPEMVDHIGSRYPRAAERCTRLRNALNDLYHREHVVSFTRAQSLGKREARTYVESLTGVTPFVTARLLHLSFDVHGIPVDEQRLRLLVAANVVPAGAPLVEVAGWLARHVKADDVHKTIGALQALTDEAWLKTQKQATRLRTPARTPAASSKSTTGRSPGRTPSKRAASPSLRKTKTKSSRSRKTSA
jgi:hypothetical protein